MKPILPYGLDVLYDSVYQKVTSQRPIRYGPLWHIVVNMLLTPVLSVTWMFSLTLCDFLLLTFDPRNMKAYHMSNIRPDLEYLSCLKFLGCPMTNSYVSRLTVYKSSWHITFCILNILTYVKDYYTYDRPFFNYSTFPYTSGLLLLSPKIGNLGHLRIKQHKKSQKRGNATAALRAIRHCLSISVC